MRLLGRKTVDLMLMNHLGGDLASMGQPRFSESSYTGIGFGLGFSVMKSSPLVLTVLAALLSSCAASPCMPREVADALKAQGRWQEGSSKGASAGKGAAEGVTTADGEPNLGRRSER